MSETEPGVSGRRARLFWVLQMPIVRSVILFGLDATMWAYAPLQRDRLGHAASRSAWSEASSGSRPISASSPGAPALQLGLGLRKLPDRRGSVQVH